MSSLTWDQVLAEQQQRARVLSPERMRAELLWNELTGQVAGLQPLPAVWWAPPAPAPAPKSPRGRGRRQPKASKAVLVEAKRTKLVKCPDGRVIVTKRRVQTYIAA